MPNPRTLSRQDDGTSKRTHPWIDFKLDLSSLAYTLWMLLGEAHSKCDHIAGVPLPPEDASNLYTVYLAKGAHATTSIEGNTLSEAQVRQQIEKELKLPKSQQYLATEVQNVLDACNLITKELLDDPSIEITPERIRKFNEMVLHNLEVGEDVKPGEIRTHNVGVGTYKAAPHEDCEDLLKQLCDWLNTDFRGGPPELRFSMVVFRAIVAHLYIAWIHPFGDGNGRTARLIEFQILAQSGLVPLPAAHLLSNHYNKTRRTYYLELDRSSKAADGVASFIQYAVQGFVDGLKEQLDYIRDRQWQITWVNYVHERFRHCDTAACARQRHLVLDMPLGSVPRKELMTISPRVAQCYATRGDKTLSRDLNALIKMQLIVKVGSRYRANRDLIRAFLPKVVGPPEL